MTVHTARRMSSRAVRLGMLSALSLTLVACGSTEEVRAYCVSEDSYQPDGSYEVFDDDFCDDDDDSIRSHHAAGYFWYYGGRLAGKRIAGGTTVRPKDAKITTAKGKVLQRGGFGGRSTGGG